MKRDGVLLIDKPSGITSRQAVSRIKSLTGVKKAGHTGTLDPLATGLLLVCLGRATLLSGILSEGVKRYWVEARLGIETDTLDTDGEIVRRYETVDVSLKDIEKIIDSYIGVIEQVPPEYSAVKHCGKPLYSYARRGIKVDREPRKVIVKRIDLISFKEENNDVRIELDVFCGPGTYIRSLVSDIGTVMGCGACVSGLRRLQSGKFLIEGAVELEHLTSGRTDVDENIMSVEKASSHIPTVVVSPPGQRGVQCGKPLLKEWADPVSIEVDPGQIVRIVSREGKLLALYRGVDRCEEYDYIAKAVRVIYIDEEVKNDEIA